MHELSEALGAQSFGIYMFFQIFPKCYATTHEASEKVGKQTVSSISLNESETNLNGNANANADTNSSSNCNRNK